MGSSTKYDHDFQSFNYPNQASSVNRNSISNSDEGGKPIRCKAAVSRNPGEPLVIEEIEVDPPQAGEVRIKILCTSLCHTDLTFWKMTSGPNAFFPRVFGHEAAGVVESVGEDVEEFKEGDTVMPVLMSNCGDCWDCKSTRSNLCTTFQSSSLHLMPRNGSTRFRSLRGEQLFHFLFVSSFSEYTVVDVAHVVKIAHDIPIHHACMLSCGVSTGVGAAMKVARVEQGSTVAIFGLGAVGLAVAAGARLCKAGRIIGIDLNPQKFELGKKFGVSEFMNPATCGDKPVSQVIKEMTDGGVDYSFECVGLASLMQEAFTSTRQGCGKTVILGVEMGGPPICVDSSELLYGRTLMGTLFGGINPKHDIPDLAQKVLNKELNVGDFITHEVSFHQINDAFDLLLEGKCLRCIIWMD